MRIVIQCFYTILIVLQDLYSSAQASNISIHLRKILPILWTASFIPIQFHLISQMAMAQYRAYICYLLTLFRILDYRANICYLFLALFCFLDIVLSG